MIPIDRASGREGLRDLAGQVIAAGLEIACLRLWKRSADGATLVLQAAMGPAVPFDGLGDRVPVDGSELGEVVRSGQPYVVSNLQDTAPPDVRCWADAQGVASFAAVPTILDRHPWEDTTCLNQIETPGVGEDRHSIGVLAAFCRTPLQERHLTALHSFAVLIAGRLGGEAVSQPDEESENLLPSLIQCLPSAVITLDRQGRVTRWNAAAQTLFGWSEAEVRGKSLPFVLDERRHEFPDDLARTLAPGRILRSRTVCRRADGSRCHVQRSAALLYDSRGAVAGRVEVFVDESHRVQISRCLQVQAQVTRIVTGCRRVEEAAPLVLAVLGEWLECAMAEFWILDEKQDALSRTAFWVASSADRERLAAIELRMQASSKGWPAEALREQNPVYCADVDSPSAAALSLVRGPLRIPVCGLAIPIRSGDSRCGVITCLGGAVGPADELTQQTLGAVADAMAQFVTRVRTEAALAQSEANLRQSQKMDAVGLLAGGVAHDFNNLLTIILSYSEMGLAEVDEDHPLHELFVEVHGAGERAAAMTRQLLAVSRQQPTRIQSVNLNRLVNDMERMLQRLIGPSLSLTRQCADGLANVQADLNHMEQVLLNLVVNARDAILESESQRSEVSGQRSEVRGQRSEVRGQKSEVRSQRSEVRDQILRPLTSEAPTSEAPTSDPPTSDRGTIVVSTGNVTLRAADVRGDGEHPGDYVQLSVRDTGCGMDAATQARIFEPFFTTKEVGRGTGMGLSTVFGIVTQAGGFLRVDSKPNAGTTFSIFLPESRDVLAVRTVDDEPDVSPGGTERILVVENDAAVRNLIRRLLEVRGYTVEEAVHGGEALEILARKGPAIDLVLTDIQMPVVDGITLARRMQLLPKPPKLLMMSGNTEPPTDLTFSGSWRFLAKPFTSNALACQVRMVLDARSDPANR